MEPPESSPPQPLPEAGEGKEDVKEADELKMGVAKDTATETSDVESPMAAQRRLTEGEGELQVEEHQEGDRMTTESLFEQESDRENKYYAKERMKEANEEKLDAARDGAKTLNVESSTVGHARVTKVEGEKEENQDTRMAEAPGETNLVEDYGKEQVMKEADEEKLESAKDSANKTLDAESSTVDQTRLNKDEGEIEQHHKAPGMARESDLRETDPVENYEPQPISLVVSLIGKGKEQMKEKDEELDAPKESESSMAAQRNLTKEGGEIEEHHVDARMPSESQETDSADDPVDSCTHAESLTSQTRGTIDEGEEHPETPGTTRESPPEKGHDQDGKRKEQMMEADEVKLDVAKGSAVETLDAESSMAAHRRLTEARSLAERANDNCFIHKVHSGLRGDESAKHYEPVLLSIGPYHHGKPPLQDMEKHKIYYSPELLDRKEQQNNATYIEALKNEKGDIQAIDCYVDTFQMDVNSFEKCMVLDGYFMIELFRRYGKYVNNDMLLNRKWMKPHLSRDMLLFENQIPLFVLRHLFALKDHSHSTEDFVKLALAFFEFNGRPIPFDHSLTSELDIIPHLLGLVYNALVSRSAQEPNHEGKSFEFIRSAAALQDVGMKFIKAKDDAAKVDAAFYDVRFSEGVLSIPHLVIDDSTESFFRNLVAYEQYSKNNSLHQVADYLQAMDCLINSAKDVELLRHRGIIDNRIGDDEKVSAMFNTLCSGVYFDQNTFFYGEMFDEVNKFCRKRRNVWMAKLKHEYFGSPWTLISFLAALLLLLLTATQTVFSVISCYRH